MYGFGSKKERAFNLIKSPFVIAGKLALAALRKLPLF
ncbi:hypothetical protein ABIB30_005188 [Pedobacter sp. UYP1]